MQDKIRDSTPKDHKDGICSRVNSVYQVSCEAINNCQKIIDMRQGLYMHEQVTRGHNIVADVWVGASNPLLHTSHSNIYKTNSRRSGRWSAVPLPCPSRLRLKLREQSSSLKRVDDLCFHT